MSGHTHFDEATEEYLEAIYRLEREGAGATTSGLAAELGVAPASVSGMIKRLVGEGHLEQRARGDARLTEKGLAVAVRVMRRHRLAECFLVKMLGMGWEEVGPDACMLEHAISPRVEERLLAVLGNPSVCPHGHPIPSLDLSEPARPGLPLAMVEPGRSVVMHAIKKKAPEVLLYLSSIGLVPGAPVEMLQRAPLGGPVTIAVAGVAHAISIELAGAILVVASAESNAA
jgi:DtxR family Mn-dependent transcriptional regulator